MMLSKCPGQDSRNIRPENIACPQCGYAVEIFTDEVKVRCPKCAHIISRQKLPSCVDWCMHARECVGEERWKKLKGR